MHEFTREARTHNQALTDLKNADVLVREHYARYPDTAISCRVQVVLPVPAGPPDDESR